MRKPLTEAAIVIEVAELAGTKVARNVIESLQRLDATLSGDDSELETVWDEICVQVQFEQSVYWDTYQIITTDFIENEISKLPDIEQAALWLQTENGENWNNSDESDRDDGFDYDSDLKEYVAERYVYSQAADWENDAIEQYLARQHEHD